MHCGKVVSTGFIPEETDTPDGGIIVRAAIQCPECLEIEIKKMETRISRITDIIKRAFNNV